MQQNPWHILDIPAGSDERTIKRAYAKILKTLDPDDRDAFIALREAYEAALHGTYWQEEEEEEESGAGGDWAQAYAEYTHDNPQDEYDGQDPQDPHDADDYAPPEDEEYAAYADTPQGRFVDACWQSWQESDSEEAMLALLHAQQEALQDFDLDTVLDYGDALLDWFYRTENHAPRAFAWAAEAYGWHAALNEWRMSHLYDRYPFIANPRLTAYPALAQWDEHWQQGFLARLAQVIHPLRRSKAEAEFAAFCRDTHPPPDAQDLPPALQALHRLRERAVFAHLLSAVPFLFLLFSALISHAGARAEDISLWLPLNMWLAYLLSAAAYETLKIAGVTLPARGVLITTGAWGAVFTLCALLADHAQEALLWLAINLAAVFMLYMAAVFWQRILARQWLGYFSQRKWWWHAFVGLVLLVFWQQAYESVQNNQRNETVFLALTGAAFAYATLCRTALPALTRLQYVSTLWQAALLLPLFWLVLDEVPVNAQEGMLRWAVVAYIITGIFSSFSDAHYRQWHYLVPLFAGLALFVAFMVGLDTTWLIKLQLGLWIVLPLAILATPRFPRAGFVLPETSRVLTQSILAIIVPLIFWHLGWYVAFVFSIGVVFYILWLEAVIDGTMP